MVRRSRAVRAASLAFALVCALAVYASASAHLGAFQASWFAVAALLALGLSFARYERRQPAVLELTPQGLAAFDGSGRTLFQGRIVGASHWAERLLVLAIAGADARRPTAFIVAADALDGVSFRELAVRGRHAAF